jgi:hypothetical protein
VVDVALLRPYRDLTPVEYQQVLDVSDLAVGGYVQQRLSVQQRPRVGGSR